MCTRFRLVPTALIVVTALILTGCATETRIAGDADMPRPAWTMYPPQPEDGKRLYVGIALAKNVLDEAQGRRLALTNAAELAAESIATDVEGIVTQIEGREGAAHKGEDAAKGDIVARVKARSSEIVRGMNPKEYYYERWKIRKHFLGASYTRYKYYVLVAYSEKEYNRLVNDIAER